MKQILISFCIVFSVAIIIGAAIEPKSKKVNQCECLKIGDIKVSGDSITGLVNMPVTASLHGVRLLDSFSTWNSNVRTFRMYLERLPVKQELGKWYPIGDCVIKIQEVSGCITWASQGLPNTEDSIVLQILKKKYYNNNNH